MMAYVLQNCRKDFLKPKYLKFEIPGNLSYLSCKALHKPSFVYIVAHVDQIPHHPCRNSLVIEKIFKHQTINQPAVLYFRARSHIALVKMYANQVSD